MKARGWLILWLVYLAILSIFLGFQVNNFFYADDFLHIAYFRFISSPLKTLWHYSLGKAFWRPLTILSDFLSYKLFKQNPAGWHFFDLVLLSIDAILLAILAKSIFEKATLGFENTGSKRALIFSSALCGMIFLLHPISLLTGAWTACRADVLGGIFALISLIITIKGVLKKKLWAFVFAGVFSILAYLCKESYFFLPLLAPFLAVFSGEKLKEKSWLGVWIFLSYAIAFSFYILLRFVLFGGIGGYEELELSLGFILPRFIYHFPKVLKKAFYDYLFWHTDSKGAFQKMVFWFLVAFGILALPRIFQKRRFFIFCILWVIFSLLPLWNLSHMLYYGESRLLFFSWMGASLLLAGAIYHLKKPELRVLGLILVLPYLALLSRTSWKELFEFQKKASEQELVRDMILSRKSELKDAKRIYVLGLDWDYYYLDPMLKLAKPKLGDKIFIPVNISSFGWLKISALKEYEQNQKPFLPKINVLYVGDDWANVSMSAPKDLVIARLNDKQARFFEWKQKRLVAIDAELFQLASRRSYYQRKYQRRIKLLPSWSFLKRNYPLLWEMSPSLEVIVPAHLGEPYKFIAKTNDPYLTSPKLSFPAPGCACIKIKMKVQKKPYLAPQERPACIFWLADEETNWSNKHKICFDVVADGKFHIYSVPVGSDIYWLRSGRIKKIRFDPISFPGWFELEFIELLSSCD